MSENAILNRLAKTIRHVSGESQTEQCLNSISNTIKKRGAYLQECSKSDLSSAVAKFPVKNKTIVNINGLSPERVDAFISGCSKVKPNLLIGTQYSEKNSQIVFADGLLTSEDRQAIGEAYIYAQICNVASTEEALRQNIVYSQASKIVGELALPEDEDITELKSYISRCGRIAVNVVPNILADEIDTDTFLADEQQECCDALKHCDVDISKGKEVLQNITFTSITESQAKEELSISDAR